MNCDVTLNLHLYDLTRDPLLQCNDGSPGGYYYREAVTEEDGDKWIFFLQGGGWCWNVTSCNDRILQNLVFGDGKLVTSTAWDPVRTVTSGIFQMEGSGWENGHLVYVPYCSGDAHLGDTEEITGEFGLIQFRGRRLARAAVSKLVGKDPNQKILFGGTSAGGRGSMVLIDHLHDLVHDTTKIYGVHDSSGYEDLLPYDTSYYPFGEQCREAYLKYQPPISSECSDLHKDTWPCVCGEAMLPHVITPSQSVLYTYDSYQLSQNLGVEPAHWTQEMCR